LEKALLEENGLRGVACDGVQQRSGGASEPRMVVDDHDPWVATVCRLLV
jgi:hypothetical protein